MGYPSYQGGGVMEEIEQAEWVVDGTTPTQKGKQNVVKHPLISIIKITDDMDVNQVKFFSERNSLIEFVKNLGLMESK
jgi:hypothetical protein